MPGLSGRRPTPTTLKLVKGNPGRRALNKSEPKPRNGNPKKPDHLELLDFASTEWDRISKLTSLKHARVLTVADGPILEATCMAYARWRAAELAITEEGLTYETTNQGGGVMIRKRPEVEIAADAWRRYVAGLTHFGLSPATRAKVQTVDEDEAKDPAEGFF
jgi:P27 family predicted phage terminase small subunit